MVQTSLAKLSTFSSFEIRQCKLALNLKQQKRDAALAVTVRLQTEMHPNFATHRHARPPARPPADRAAATKFEK